MERKLTLYREPTRYRQNFTFASAMACEKFTQLSPDS